MWAVVGPAGETTVTETGTPMDQFTVDIQVGLSSFGAAETGTQTDSIYGAGFLLRPLVNYTIEFDYTLSTWDSYSTFDGFWDVLFVHANSTGFYWNLVTGAPVADLACSSLFAPAGTPPLNGPLWTFGGLDWGNGVLCTGAGTFMFTYMEPDPTKTVYLSVGLDTGLTGDVDGLYPSWGTFSVRITGQDCPDNPDLGSWNAPAALVATQVDNNCYNYATNRPTNTFAQPGVASGMPFPNLTCADVSAAAIADGLCQVASPDDCDGDYCVVALVVAPGPPVNPGADYHWYRLNDDGTWSHKPGSTRARTHDSAGMPITDPATADRTGRLPGGASSPGYTQFCGYFCVPGDVTLLPSPAPVAGGTGISVTVNFSAGVPSPGWTISDEATITELQALLATAEPTDPPADSSNLGFAGFVLTPFDVPGFPEFVQVFDGIIEIIDGGTIEYRITPALLEQLLLDGAAANDADDVFTFCPGDLNLNGSVDAADLATLLGAWGPVRGVGISDLNGDGVVDAADLAQLLGAWGPCD